MRFIANVVWLLLGGIWLALGYFLAGVLACILIITIPAGVASFRMASYVLWPFGRAVVSTGRGETLAGITNIIWFLIAGWWLAVLHVVTALAQSITIVGLLSALVNLKMIPVTCFPFGKRIVNRDDLVASQRPLHSL